MKHYILVYQNLYDKKSTIYERVHPFNTEYSVPCGSARVTAHPFGCLDFK